MNSVLELLLPRLEPEDQLNPPRFFAHYDELLRELPPLLTEPAVLQRLFELSCRLYDDEERRRESVLARVSPTLTTAGFALALFGLLAQQLHSLKYTWVAVVVSALLLVSLAYLIFAIIVVLRVYRPPEKTPYYMLDPDDLLPLRCSESSYVLEVSKKMISYAEKNYKPRNLAMTRIDKCQRLVRNGFVSLGLAAGVLLVYMAVESFTRGDLWIL
jgi:hypothetical protein